MRVLGRFILAAAAGLLVLLIGVLSSMILGGFAVLERSAPPSNGFLILEFLAIGILTCVRLSIAAACWVLLRPGNNCASTLPENRSGLFLGQ
jgi:hypothetical protein